MKKITPALILLLCISKTVYSASAFNVTLDSEGQTSFQNFDDVENFFDGATSDSFAAALSNYTDNSAAIATLDIRGVEAISTYTLNSTTLTFTIPALGISETFGTTATNRAESEQEFRDFLKSNGRNLLTRILQQAVATTGIDPVAGNPDSLSGSMVSSDYDNATKRDQVSIGFSGGHSSIDGHEKNIVTLPLSYTHYYSNPGYQLKLSAPISYVETDGSKSYKASFGAGLQIPIRENWFISPALRLGILGSEDLGAAAIITSASITSVYNKKINDMNLSFGNMVGILQTKGIDAGGYDIDYDLSNQVLKNGVSLEVPSKIKFKGQSTSWEGSIANTLFLGDEVFIDNYYDLALSLGMNKNTGGEKNKDSLRLGFTYTKGNNGYTAAKLNLGYTF